VSTEAPVTVFVAADDEDDPVDDDGPAAADEDGPDAPVPGLVVPVATDGAATDTAWVLNDSRPTRPAMVPKRAKTTRLTGVSLSGAWNQNSKDS
jgi:hypothetical protein